MELGKEWTLCVDVCPGGAGGSPALVAHDLLEHGQRDRDVLLLQMEEEGRWLFRTLALEPLGT